jgi:excisionase family DNA binding protein
VTAATAALHRAAHLLGDRLAQLAERIAGGDESAWADYAAASVALAQLAAALAPGANGRLLTTAELAESLNVSVRQVRRLKKAGRIAPAVKLGRALRWRAEAAR